MKNIKGYISLLLVVLMTVLFITPAFSSATEVETSEVQVTDNVFTAQFEGDEVEGTAENIDGVYRIKATKTDGESWHIKLECNYHTTPGRDYRVTYNFKSDVAGTVKFGDNQEFSIVAGENTVTGMYVATSNISYLDLQLGALPPFTVDFTSVEVEELQDDGIEYEDVTPSDFRFDAENVVSETHEKGYEQELKLSEKEATLHFVAVPSVGEAWNSKLLVRSGFTPKAGERYRISAELTTTKSLDFEACFNNSEAEKGYGALYNQRLEAGAVKTVEQTITIPKKGLKLDELVFQFALGMAKKNTDVTVNKICIEKVSGGYTSVLPSGFSLDSAVFNGNVTTDYVPVSFTEVPLTNFSYSGTDSVYENHDEGYTVKLEESANSAVMKITKAPEKAEDRGVWKAKMYADTDLELKVGKTYRVKFDLYSAKDQAQYEACFDGDVENAFGALYDRKLTAGGTDKVEYVITPTEKHGKLVIRLQLGNTDTAKGNTFKLSNLSVETLEAGQNVGSVSYDTGSSGNVWEENSDGIEQSVSSSDGSATLNVTKARDGGGVWSSRLFAATGVTPEAGARYKVVVGMSSTKAIDEFEVVCDNGGAEAGYAKQTGLSLNGSGSYSLEFNAPDSGCNELVLRFQLGNSPAGNAITVSSIQVMKLTSESVDVALTGFAYPVTTDAAAATVPAAYEAQTVSASAFCNAWDASEATAWGGGNSATLNVTKAREGGGLWSTHMYVGTGVALEKGAQYRVTAAMSSVEAIENFEVLFTNGSGDESSSYADGYYGLSIGAGGVFYISREFTAPDLGTNNDLNLRFQLGNSPAPNTVTVSDISIEKLIPEHEEVSGGSTENNSFFLETNAGTEAALTGDGSSATATITTPGDDWHIKMYAKPGVTLESGKTYQISMNVSGASGCQACYKRVGGEETDFGSETISSGTVDHTVTPAESGELEILLKLGTVPANGQVKVSGISIKTVGVETAGENLATSGLTTGSRGSVNFWAHDDYSASLSSTGSSATLSVNSVPADGREAWKVKFFMETGIALSSDKNYRISADVKSSNGIDYEICYNNAEHEKELGAKYGLHASGTSETVSYEVSPAVNSNLILQFNLGNAAQPESFTISNVKVMELGSASSVLPSFRYDSVGSFSSAVDNGYVTKLEKADSSATFSILQAPDDRNPWNAKLFIKTGFTPENGKGYRASFDVDASKAQNLIEAFYDGNSESAYGALYEQILKSGKNNISYVIVPGDSKGELIVQFRPGKTDSKSGNSYKISNVKLEEGEFITQLKYEYDETASVWAHDDYSASITKTADTAKVKISRTPGESELEPWKTKLFIDTGVTLNKGEKYRISFDASADSESYFEICYNDGGEEKGLGAQYGLTAYPEAKNFEYTTYPQKDGHLVIQLSLGKIAAPNGFSVSNVKIEKLESNTTLSKCKYLFPQMVASIYNGKGDGNLQITPEELKYTMTEISGFDGNNKITVANIPLDYSHSYTVKFRAKSDKDLTAVFALNKMGEWDTVLYEEISLGSQWQDFTYSVPSGYAKDANYELLVQFGSANNAKQESAVVEISDIKVEADK